MRISVAADELTGVARALLDELRRRGHETLAHGALGEGGRKDWAWASEAAARDVAEQRAEQAIVCCWTGTGASIAANKVGGVRAALCLDAATAAGARRSGAPAAQAPASAAKAGLWERSRRSMPYQSLLP
jgi:ribose 5-phosphate isomerase B